MYNYQIELSWYSNMLNDQITIAKAIWKLMNMYKK